VKQVSSHRWTREKYGNLDARAVISGHLRRAGAVLVPSQRLLEELGDAPHVTLCPKGFHPESFGDAGERRGDLVVGWAGSQNAVDKRLAVIAGAWPALKVASSLAYDEMPDFYNSIDVITCASDAEGDPRPLIEGMACGCFPVTVDVGIVPELVRHGENGLIVERTPQAFADAFAWCRANLDHVREAGRRNAEEMLATRTWAKVAPLWGDAFAAAIDRAPEWKINAREERKARILVARKKRAAARANGAV
jgi:glycosyltransferase involved in cell wall biosynthesis